MSFKELTDCKFLAVFLFCLSCTHASVDSVSVMPNRTTASEKFCEEEVSAYSIPLTETELEAGGKTTKDNDVVLCKKMFVQRPLIHLPLAKAPEKYTKQATHVEIYGGIYFEQRLNYKFFDRNGNSFTITNLQGINKDPNKLERFKTLLRPFTFPSNRVFYTLYKVSGNAKVENDNSLSINIESIKPVLQLTGEAIDSYLVGKSLEGGYYKMDQRFQQIFQFPLRVKLSSLSKHKSPGLDKLAEWEQAVKIPDAEVFSIDGEIENFDDGVIASDKSCFKPIMRAEEKNPFIGAIDPRVAIYRRGAMHIAGDSVVVFEYPQAPNGQPPQDLTRDGMDAENRLLNIVNFIQLKLEDNQPWNHLSIKPHGPNRAHLIKLQAIEGKGQGGTPCN